MPEVVRRERSAVQTIRPEELVGYVNSMQAGTKKGTYYNEANEQVSALNDGIRRMLEVCRPFGVLMSLHPATRDDARIATIMQAFSTEPKIEGADVQAIRKWECSVFQDVLSKMPPTRAFDLFSYMIGFRHEKVSVSGSGLRGRSMKTIFKRTKPSIGSKYLRGMVKRWLAANEHRLDLWSVKYTNDFKRLARHVHLSPEVFEGIGFVFGKDRNGEAVKPNGPMQKAVQAVREADSGKIPAALWKLPMEVARGFALSKFGMTKEDFEKRFSEKGQKTLKEARTSEKRAVKAGGKSQFDPSKAASLFELLVYLGGQDTIPRQAATWVESVAAREAGKFNLRMEDCAVILDTSPSMFGGRETPRHPLFRGLAVAKILEKSSQRFKLFYTSGQSGSPVIPVLGGASGYADAVLRALEDGFTRIFLVGDGYENSPEGMTHRVVHAFKKQIDTEDRVSFVHLNPVHAAESTEAVRELTPMIPAAAVSSVDGLGSSIFLAMAKSQPIRALEAYFVELERLQGPSSRTLMPVEYRRMLPAPRME